MASIPTLRRILQQNKTLAVVGLSAKWHRPSFFAAKYMQDHGYRIIPVNPNYDEILGEKSYPDLASIPEPVDIVDLFQKSETAPDYAHQAIAIKAKVLWLQLGVINHEAEKIASQANMDFVMNHCVKIEHARLFGGLNFMGVNTHIISLHAGTQPDPATGSRATPIYQTASYIFDDTDHAASLFNLQTFGNVYTRLMNPTTAMFEERMAALEGGRAAVATSTGMAAQMTALLTLLKEGDEIVAASTLYGGTVSQFAVTFRRMGIHTVFVDPDDPHNFEKAITDRTRVIYGETVGNPNNNVLDIEAVADIAHANDLPLVIDNTFASPYLCRPIEFGADIVVHSATKFICGHGTSMGGMIVESGKFPWDNGKFQDMTAPSGGYHGVRFYETFGDFAFTMKARCETLRTLGPTLSPFNAFMMLQGLETLPLRMDRHVSNARKVVQFLKRHEWVNWVKYAGDPDNPYYSLSQKYLGRGAGAILTFGIRGGQKAGAKFIENMAFMSHLANVGDAKTLVIHPASTTHRQLNEKEQLKAGVSPDMIRISVGLESIEDIIWDIDQALKQSR